MIDYLAKLITLVCDLLVVPFGRTHQTLSLVWLSLLTGVGMAYVFKHTSNQAKIRLAKDRFKSYILEMRIYQDDLRSIFSALFGALGSNFKYLALTFKPLLVLIIPVVIIFMQMDERYGRSNLSPGQSTILSLELKRGHDAFTSLVSIESSEGIHVDAGPVRIREHNRLDWRLKVDTKGTHKVSIISNGKRYELTVVAERSYKMIGARKSSSSFIEPLLHPALPPIPEDSVIESVAIQYPGASYPFLKWQMHWIVIFIIYSIIGALIVKFAVGFEI